MASIIEKTNTPFIQIDYLHQAVVAPLLLNVRTHQTNCISSAINNAMTTIGITKLIQSDDDPLGLLWIIFLAAGNITTINKINAIAEIISIHSIIIFLGFVDVLR